jgi:hypothetical protein
MATKIEPLPTSAEGWLFAMLHPDHASIFGLPDFLTVREHFLEWLRADPRHRVQFGDVQRTWRLIKPLLRATEPGAGTAEMEAFLDALEEERVRDPKRWLTDG